MDQHAMSRSPEGGTAASETTGCEPGLKMRVFALLDDLSDQTRNAEELAALGVCALDAMREYLEGRPQIVPHARCFAVSMIARLHVDAASNALRDALRFFPLAQIEPAYRESEYVVKSEIMRILAMRAHPSLRQDVAYAIGERLKIGLLLAGEHGLVEHAAAIADMLLDDVLSGVAEDALCKMGGPALNETTARIETWLGRGDARHRLGALRALRVATRIGISPQHPILRLAAEDGHGMIRAIAACALGAHGGRDAFAAVVEGALSCDEIVTMTCRMALERDRRAGCADLIRRVVQRRTTHDIYGNEKAIPSDRRPWLLRYVQRIDSA